ncbi:Cobalt-zinc-cadmium resistance protein [Grimontia indica]|uniref:Cobalt-zinc-cadmium resistance protein n=1 Tax=Grimontia indica TaxID=1056512 RepID=R1ITP1_9GAMM|nr:cation transporter [Grimontia indica]EOD80842.1 Cobalt-zinc-cadmium resistance protein [Grimontia indica]
MKDTALIVTEERALKVSIVANLVMAFSGWVTYYLSGSEALLLDGNLSFILFLSSIVALRLTRVKALVTDDFPFGKFAGESMYTLFKGIMILGVLLSSITTNIGKIFGYIEGEPTPPLVIGPIMIYTLAMVAICLGLAFYYRNENKKVQYNSMLLDAEAKSSLVDGVLSAAIGIALIAIIFVDIHGAWGFLHYIGDAIVVVLLGIAMMPQPTDLIRCAFHELMGGSLKDEDEQREIDTTIRQLLSARDIQCKELLAMKVGSSYLIIVCFTAEVFKHKSDDLVIVRKEILDSLCKTRSFVDLELVLD